MEQWAYYINCPLCGTTQDVVCPILDKQMKEVWPARGGYGHLDLKHVYEKPHFVSKYTCKKCGRSLEIYWCP